MTQNKMYLNRQQTEALIELGQKKGVTGKAIIDSLIEKGYQVEGVDSNAILQSKQPTQTAQPTQRNIIQRTGDNIKEVIQNPAVLGDRLKAVTPQLNLTRDEQGNVVGNKEGVEDVVQNVVDVATGSGVVRSLPIQKAVQVGSDVVSAGVKGVGGVAQGIANTVDISKKGFLKTLAPSIDDSVKTVLQKTNPSKFDEFVKTASRNASDNNAPSVYEKVADSMSNATEQIASQTRSLSQQKSAIISKAKNGLTDFTKETGETILDINRALKNSPVAKSFIERLKTVKNKIDADKAIDELQDILYRGKKDMTIPTGSIEERTLSSIIGRYNTKLKQGLPASYANINKQIADRLSTLDDLNRALGEVVEGVPIRGAGLVKQYFSPAGTKAKQLFQFVKKNTGIDLAEDAVLAKYIGNAFGDAKVRSLLEGGIPTSTGGALNRGLDFVLEKTGANKAIETIKREGMIEKARGNLPKKSK